MHKVFVLYTYIYYENVQVVVGIADAFNTYCVDASLYLQKQFFFCRKGTNLSKKITTLEN